ncbi:AMP-dependent synthetase/ligase [Cesiribacter andamanensis]|uniref:Long-chain-fatty-acid--CoA ligase FadD15 n=1 Tax=Cesiribacter andamanensis AMV16 TaxID=1279009 RepID=M7NWI0_9BACT|nr:long-chain fatty acid--CoA ligase [Cesiribacter andamanensis]EMR02784.1 Long-chain-fatty-acid--CoA ligase FadD15 [Cesiribacter andamanensis AMV16]
MKEAKRLFDCLHYQLAHFPLPDMLAGKEGGAWRSWSSQEVADTSLHLSTGLHALGLGPGDWSAEGRHKIAIISKNRPEWMVADLAIQQLGAVVVPLYPNISEQELQFVLADAGVQLAFVNDQDLYRKLQAQQSRLPALKAIYTFERVPGAPHWTDLLQEPDAPTRSFLSQQAARISEEDLASILYTSGTTGNPKGVMLSHRNIMSDVEGCNPLVREVGIQGKRALSFLPLNHAFERVATYIYILNGTAIYYAESMETIGDNLREARPVIFTTVPRLLEKVYERIMAKGAELKGPKKWLFDWSIGLAKKFEINQHMGGSYQTQLALANKLVFSKWREALGGEVKAVIVGAAACPVKLQKIFTAARVVIMEGYGLTEAAPIISGNRYGEKNRKFGTVGPPLHNVEVRIALDGEVLCKGPMVMMGYYKRPDLTAGVISEGWLYTGDIGELIEGKFLKITDRKKEMFKTSGGKYVAPQAVEVKLQESRWIEQIMVVGPNRKYVGALIVPAFLLLKEWYADQGQEYPGDAAASRDPRVEALIKKAVIHLNEGLNPVEQVKQFTLLPGEWTVAAGELTPTLKLRRKVIAEHYQQEIDSMYLGS